MSKIDHLIEQEMAANHIPGLAAAIIIDGETAWQGCYGDANIELKVPVSASTVFEIASITKLFTATAVMQLVIDGRISLHENLTAYLPWAPSTWEPITIHHILRHSSGLKGYTEIKEYWDTTRLDISKEAILELIRDRPLLYQPGERYSYDNTGYFLLGMVLEAVTGQSYGEILQQQIFKPLDMHNTHVNNPYEPIDGRARGYTYEHNRIRNAPYYSPSGTFSAGILLSTIEDMAKWDHALYGETLLPRAAQQQMWTAVPSQAQNERQFDFSMGLGWYQVDYNGYTFSGHNGSIVGFASSYMRFLDQGVSVVLFVNSDMVSMPHEIAWKIVMPYLKK